MESIMIIKKEQGKTFITKQQMASNNIAYPWLTAEENSYLLIGNILGEI